MFDQIFLTQQLKQSIVISNKHGIYELPHDLPNHLRLRILENQEKFGESQDLIKLKPIAQSQKAEIAKSM